jgi:ArsR family transcriptional regulator, lead/cadmium/zinc/bismuth-responsive transcriptional repressor
MNINPKCIRKKIDYDLINQAQGLIKEQRNLLKTKSDIFSLVGNEIRLSIVYLLMNYEKLCVCDISNILSINQSSISQHLRKLKDGKLIDNARDGSTIFYFINEDNKLTIKKIMEV